ncbi:hypothetical protein J5N58_24395 [Rhizobium cremeum]|uniref:hypothetical protein n=1 Tax=Rhizobium cremeum TaxID=2813827 RepID=UPI001FD5F509|nr:hypothetical protein [Rhizobium cremeum]MCJ7997734.1 hypothetical protein [Rhizobium cremeum]MCJ8002828.1 hypothetical protein [Rhizobium cremeum]
MLAGDTVAISARISAIANVAFRIVFDWFLSFSLTPFQNAPSACCTASICVMTTPEFICNADIGNQPFKMREQECLMKSIGNGFNSADFGERREPHQKSCHTR